MKKALIVGINEYAGVALLKGCVNCANAVANTLKSANYQLNEIEFRKEKDEKRKDDKVHSTNSFVISMVAIIYIGKNNFDRLFKWNTNIYDYFCNHHFNSIS